MLHKTLCVDVILTFSITKRHCHALRGRSHNKLGTIVRVTNYVITLIITNYELRLITTYYELRSHAGVEMKSNQGNSNTPNIETL